MAKPVRRFEVRCEPAFVPLIEAVRKYEGDATASALFRRLVFKRAVTFAARNPNCEVARLLKDYEGRES